MKLSPTFLLLFVLITSCGSAPIQEEQAVFEIDPMVIEIEMSSALMLENQVFEGVNAHREEKGLSELVFSNVAYVYAEEHNDYMIAKGRISHDNFNSRASSLALETGAIAIEENVAKNFPKAQQALKGWLNSKSHRETIEGDFTHTAINVKADEKGKLYYTQLFFKK